MKKNSSRHPKSKGWNAHPKNSDTLTSNADSQEVSKSSLSVSWGKGQHPEGLPQLNDTLQEEGDVDGMGLTAVARALEAEQCSQSLYLKRPLDTQVSKQ